MAPGVVGAGFDLGDVVDEGGRVDFGLRISDFGLGGGVQWFGGAWGSWGCFVRRRRVLSGPFARPFPSGKGSWADRGVEIEAGDGAEEGAGFADRFAGALAQFEGSGAGCVGGVCGVVLVVFEDSVEDAGDVGEEGCRGGAGAYGDHGSAGSADFGDVGPRQPEGQGIDGGFVDFGDVLQGEAGVVEVVEDDRSQFGRRVEEGKVGKGSVLSGRNRKVGSGKAEVGAERAGRGRWGGLGVVIEGWRLHSTDTVQRVR